MRTMIFIEHAPAFHTNNLRKNFPYPQQVRTTAVTILQTWKLVFRSSNMLKVRQQASGSTKATVAFPPPSSFLCVHLLHISAEPGLLLITHVCPREPTSLPANIYKLLGPHLSPSVHMGLQPSLVHEILLPRESSCINIYHTDDDVNKCITCTAAGQTIQSAFSTIMLYWQLITMVLFLLGSYILTTAGSRSQPGVHEVMRDLVEEVAQASSEAICKIIHLGMCTVLGGRLIGS